MRYVKNNDLWKASIQYTYLNGTWQRIRDVSGNVNGVWKSTIPPIGTFIEGGYVAGIIDTLASGGERYIVLVSPKEYQTYSSTAYNLRSSIAISKWNGAANTVSLAAAFAPATYCANLVTNDGYSDWYLPAVDELELCYRNFKPTNVVNDTSRSYNYFNRGNTCINGYNESSDPVCAGYISGPTNPPTLPEEETGIFVGNPYRQLLSGFPMKTQIGIFQEGQSQSFWPPLLQEANNTAYATSTVNSECNININIPVLSTVMTILFYSPQCGNYTTRSGKQFMRSYNHGWGLNTASTRPIRRIII